MADATPTTPIDPKLPKILCVDDDQIFRTRLVRALNQRGYEVYQAANAEEGIILAKRHQPERAIIDMRMPGMGGLDLIDALARIDPDIDIIVLTGYGSIPTAVEAVRRGARDYLTKPVDTDQILQTFERDPDAAHNEVPDSTPSLARVEWEHIQRILVDCGNNISQAARKAGYPSPQPAAQARQAAAAGVIQGLPAWVAQVSALTCVPLRRAPQGRVLTCATQAMCGRRLLSMLVDMPSPMDERRLQCLEVWGGNEPARTSVSLSGLDAWVQAIPHANSDAGGDVHYLSSCAAGQVTRMFLADVSGHGNAVAEIARSLRTLMRQHVNHHTQLGFVKKMNKAFTEQSEAGIFATALVCTYFAPRGELSICNAGHPAPLWYRAETQRWQLLTSDNRSAGEDPSNIPLGIIDMADYDQTKIRFAPNDRVLCYTDSLIEARAADGEMLGTTGLLEIINALPPTASAQLIDALWEALRQRVGDTLLNDDVTMLLVTPNASSRRDTFLNKAYAPLRVIGHWLLRR